MNVIPNIDLSNYERAFTVIDTHTQGEFTRIVLDGMPKIEGSTMVEKRKYLQEHYSHLREALLLEPRGIRTASERLSLSHATQGPILELCLWRARSLLTCAAMARLDFQRQPSKQGW